MSCGCQNQTTDYSVSPFGGTDSFDITLEWWRNQQCQFVYAPVLPIDPTARNLYFAIYRELCECGYPWLYSWEYQSFFEYEDPVLDSNQFAVIEGQAVFTFSSAQTAELYPTDINRGRGRYRYFLLQLLPDGADSVLLQSGVLLVYNAPAYPPGIVTPAASTWRVIK
jgi:hypothetical protein